MKRQIAFGGFLYIDVSINDIAREGFEERIEQMLVEKGAACAVFLLDELEAVISSHDTYRVKEQDEMDFLFRGIRPVSRYIPKDLKWHILKKQHETFQEHLTWHKQALQVLQELQEKYLYLETYLLDGFSGFYITIFQKHRFDFSVRYTNDSYHIKIRKQKEEVPCSTKEELMTCLLSCFEKQYKTIRLQSVLGERNFVYTRRLLESSNVSPSLREGMLREIRKQFPFEDVEWKCKRMIKRQKDLEPSDFGVYTILPFFDVFIGTDWTQYYTGKNLEEVLDYFHAEGRFV